MTAAALRRPVPERGLRPVDPRGDMRGMADLIEVAFAERLDESGRRMVRSMRAFGKWGWPGWALGHLFLPPAAYPEGYVWIEDERLVGNASLMRADLGSKRWVLINVAVAPGWRRRGIAPPSSGARGRRSSASCFISPAAALPVEAPTPDSPRSRLTRPNEV